MSKYLDFIGQQISQNKSVEGSPNTDIESSDDSGVLSQVKKHGLKVAGGIAVVAGSVFAYKHFTKPSDSQNDVLVDLGLTDNLASSSPSNVQVNEEITEETLNIEPEVEVQGEFTESIFGQQEPEETKTLSTDSMVENILSGSNNDDYSKKMASQMGLELFQGDEMQNFLDSTEGKENIKEGSPIESIQVDEVQDQLLGNEDPFKSAISDNAGLSQYIEDQGTFSG